jgi:hypothetical protein
VRNTRHSLPSDAVQHLERHWPSLPWSDAKRVHGAFHVVYLFDSEAVIRVRVGQQHEAGTRADYRAAELLSDAGLDCPRPLDSPLIRSGWSANMTTYASGDLPTPSTWNSDRGWILSALDSLQRTAHESPHLAGALAPVRSWCGGTEWRDIVDAVTKTDANAGVREQALRCVDAVLEAEQDVTPTLVHGDFGPHNLLLHEGSSAPSIIDTDNAAWADPATDIAPLLSHYPAEDLSPDFPPLILQRAVLIKRSLALQIAAAGETAGDTELRDHALRNFARRIPAANRTHQGRPFGR